MKKYLIIVLALVSTTLFAQKRTVNIGDFNEVKIFNGLRVTLHKSDKQYVSVFGDDTEEIIVKNVNGTLKISAKLGKKIWGEDLYVKVYYKALDLIDANEGSLIKSSEIFKQNMLTVKAQEGARIQLNIAVNDLDVKTISGGSITLNGTAKNQDVIANTGGFYEGFSLQSETGTAKVASGGEAELYVTERIKATASLGGEIYIKGKPKNVKNKATLGGMIKISHSE